MLKMKKTALISGIAIAFVLSGCSINPVDYETDPVQVASPKGTVTCQLYKKDQVVWDRAISVPAGMSVTAGDNICKEEGLRLKAEG
jgi:PBP1b-binding outer membrane lipoprotein LpoB